MLKKVSFKEFWATLASKDYWIMVFRIGFPIMLIFDALKVILVQTMLIALKMSACLKIYNSSSICITEDGLSFGFILSALLVICGCIGLILKKNWARAYIFIIFLHYLVFWTLFLYYAFDNILIALSRTSVALLIYIIAIYVYTRPKVKALFSPEQKSKGDV